MKSLISFQGHFENIHASGKVAANFHVREIMIINTFKVPLKRLNKTTEFLILNKLQLEI